MRDFSKRLREREEDCYMPTRQDKIVGALIIAYFIAALIVVSH